MAGYPSATPDDLSRAALRAYLAHLRRLGYARSTVARRLSAVRSLCKFLRLRGRASHDPAAALKTPRGERKLPRVLSADEATELVATPSGPGFLETRDKALLETLYATGLRVSELVGLNLVDLDLVAESLRPVAKARKNGSCRWGSGGGGVEGLSRCSAARRWRGLRPPCPRLRQPPRRAPHRSFGPASAAPPPPTLGCGQAGFTPHPAS